MTLVVGCMLLVATVLTPLLWHLWIHAGSANANFYFAMSVVYGIPQVCVSCYPRGGHNNTHHPISRDHSNMGCQKGEGHTVLDNGHYSKLKVYINAYYPPKGEEHHTDTIKIMLQGILAA